jgi:hypothetical protein
MSEKICIQVQQIIQTIETKKLYVPNKTILYELTEQIIKED